MSHRRCLTHTCANPNAKCPRSAVRSILANERNNAKFNFLVPGDPYHAYYQHKVRRFGCLRGIAPHWFVGASGGDVQGGRCGHCERAAGGTMHNAAHPSTFLTHPACVQAAKGAAAGAEAAPERVAVQTATNFKPVVLEAPEKVQCGLQQSLGKNGRVCADALPVALQEQYTIALPDGISAFDLDVIKLTAQFVARNGKSFLTGLTSREHMNPQARRRLWHGVLRGI